MSIREYFNILKQLEENTVDCSLEEEQKYVRKAYDKNWALIFKLSGGPIYPSFYETLSINFVREVEKRRKRARNSWLEQSLLTCPEKRLRLFNYPSHCMCLGYIEWEIFHNQMRIIEHDKYTTVLLMCVESVDGVKKCRVEENDDVRHAEQNALRFLRKFKPKKIDMYISTSPCKQRCLPELNKFINTHTVESFRIRFSSVHNHKDIYEMKSLWKLKADIGVFKEKDWYHLEKHLTKEAYSQLRQEFMEMNVDENGAATSEEEDEYTESSFTDESDESENNHYETRSDYSSDENNNENEARSKRNYEDDDSDGISSKHYKKCRPIKYDDDDDDTD